MLEENTLFGISNKVDTAIERIRYFEPKDGSGYYVAFSGGKDSIVIKHLTIQAGVKYDIHFNFTTVDPPELIEYIRQFHSDVQVHRPKESMFQLIIRKRLPPTRIIRFCCEKLKEYGGDGRLVLTGVRWAESIKRRQRMMFEICKRHATKSFLHPIIDWSDEDVWEYIRRKQLPYCSLYNEGFKRIGCVGCPIANRKAEFQRWPKFERAYKHAIKMMIEKNKADYAAGIYLPPYGKSDIALSDVKTIWRWWLQENKAEPNRETQCMLFG